MGAIPIVVNDKVDFWVHYFKTSGRAMFMRWLVRGETQKKLVKPILQDSGVPMEFFYLAMIESGLSNSANSRARAIGTWQFMKGTAKLYGLKINHWVDERRDPVKSTIAAARYLKDLYLDLGDWHLAMAAYNAGPGRVHRAMKLNGNSDFWHLCDTRDLAKETKEYVPKVLAAIMLAADPEAHGFRVSSNDEVDPADTTVTIKHPVRLTDLAQKLGVPLRTLKRWNPELLRNVTPPAKNGYALRLSSAYASRFPQLEPGLASADIKGVHVHTVRRGETLSRIARHYGVAIKTIMDLNPELAASKLKPGSSVLIPADDALSTVNSKSTDVL
jgi:membrane-bound lytic murein transglycosylase D